MAALEEFSQLQLRWIPKPNIQLDGGAADEEGRSSSASRERLRLRAGARPRFAADMFGRKGKLVDVSMYIVVIIGNSSTSLASGCRLLIR